MIRVLLCVAVLFSFAQSVLGQEKRQPSPISVKMTKDAIIFTSEQDVNFAYYFDTQSVKSTSTKFTLRREKFKSIGALATEQIEGCCIYATFGETLMVRFDPRIHYLKVELP